MITTKKNGDAIKELWLPGDGNAFDTSYSVGRAGVISITLQTDREELWAHVKMENREESVNLKQVTSVVWS